MINGWVTRLGPSTDVAGLTIGLNLAAMAAQHRGASYRVDVLAQSPELRSLFHESLHRAIAQGSRPALSNGLGAETRTALDVIAHEHPDATVDHIALAFDAFGREHREHVATV
jgi:hypothetical protein